MQRETVRRRRGPSSKKKTKVLRLVYYNNLAVYVYLYIKIGTYTHIDNDCTRVYRRKYGIVVKLLL